MPGRDETSWPDLRSSSSTWQHDRFPDWTDNRDGDGCEIRVAGAG